MSAHHLSGFHLTPYSDSVIPGTGLSLDVMATLEKLQEQKHELEARLAAGDLTAEAALERIDRAISARTQKIAHSQKRLAAVKNAVDKGVPLQDTKPTRVAARAAASSTKKKQPLNRFK
ncbi:MAG: hypothetical protein QF790_06535 [Gammaproteobacteria bacterium]|nr:hypothetical protein [Gammaproteobacteria bacterium]MDP6616804.1 hypothetical protein [Gammaproteobacteria bacterium]